MTIQISVLIWTILCFGFLAFVLNKYMFKPILKVMDSRNEKIEKDKIQRQTAKEEAEKKRLEAEAARLAAHKKAVEESEAAIENIRQETVAALADKKAEYNAYYDKMRAGFKEESLKIQSEFGDEIDALALAYAESLIAER